LFSTAALSWISGCHRNWPESGPAGQTSAYPKPHAVKRGRVYRQSFSAGAAGNKEAQDVVLTTSCHHRNYHRRWIFCPRSSRLVELSEAQRLTPARNQSFRSPPRPGGQCLVAQVSVKILNLWILPYVIPAEAGIQEMPPFSIGSGFPLAWE
jgi:hypothetical protein